MKNCYIYIISDSLGETGEHVAKAAAGQFKDVNFIIKKYPYMDNVKRVKKIIDEAASRRAVLVFTTVIHEIRKVIIDRCKHHNLFYIDVMNPLIYAFKNVLGQEPVYEPGTIHKLDETYFSRVKAIEFAVKYDDGKDPRGVKLADIILLGISRTSKTPLSMYLAHKNLKVANIPLVPEVPVPKEVYEIEATKIIGLVNTPEKLFEIREERLRAMGLMSNANYANMDRIKAELDYAGEIFDKIGCPVIDVSNKAVEETANIILQIIIEQRAAILPEY